MAKIIQYKFYIVLFFIILSILMSKEFIVFNQEFYIIIAFFIVLYSLKRVLSSLILDEFNYRNKIIKDNYSKLLKLKLDLTIFNRHYCSYVYYHFIIILNFLMEYSILWEKVIKIRKILYLKNIYNKIIIRLNKNILQRIIYIKNVLKNVEYFKTSIKSKILLVNNNINSNKIISAIVVPIKKKKKKKKAKKSFSFVLKPTITRIKFLKLKKINKKKPVYTRGPINDYKIRKTPKSTKKNIKIKKK
jgi:hypothetical protein